MTIMMAKDLFPVYEVDCRVITTTLVVRVYSIFTIAIVVPI